MAESVETNKLTSEENDILNVECLYFNVVIMPTTETKRKLLMSASNKDTEQKKLSFFSSARRQDVESSSSPSLVESTSGSNVTSVMDAELSGTDLIVEDCDNGMSVYTMFSIFFNV